MEHYTKNFSALELRCKCEVCRREEPHQIPEYIVEKLQSIRDLIGIPLTLSSAYRCENHPSEMMKAVPGSHNRGAFDIKCPDGALGYKIMVLALELGATGIGFSLANKDRSKRFIHIDFDPSRTTPVVWSY